jgi:hypothetical protein
MAAEVRGRVAFGAFVANLIEQFPQAVSAATARFSNSLICLPDSLALITLNSLSGHRLDIPGRVGLRRA